MAAASAKFPAIAGCTMPTAAARFGAAPPIEFPTAGPMTLVYLPLKLRQSLSIGNNP